MKVAELIEELKRQPQDALVGYNEPDGGYASWWYEIDSLTYVPQENRYDQRPPHTVMLGA